MGIHHYDQKLEKIEKKVLEGQYPEQNKETIIEYEHVLFAEGLSIGRVYECIYMLDLISRGLDTPFRDVSKLDMYKFIGDIEKSDRSVYTKREYKIITKKFFRWLNGGEDPETTKWIKTSLKKSQGKMPDELLTEEEVLKIINAARHPRDAALIAIGYDSGARIGEIGGLLIKHVNFDQYGAYATVDGKTGMRRVRLVMSTPYIATWLSCHPYKDNPDAPLWVNIGRKSHGLPMRYEAMKGIFKETAKRAGIQKRVYCHLFRHSRSTDLAQHLTEAQMNEHLGWVQGSNMPQTYVHLSGKQIDDAILKVYGLSKEETKEPLLAPIKCIRCTTINAPGSRFCMSCGMALTTEAATSVDYLQELSMKLMLEICKLNPEEFQRFKEQAMLAEGRKD